MFFWGAQVEYTERDYEFAGLQRFGRASLVALAAASLCYSAPDPALAFRVCAGYALFYNVTRLSYDYFPM